MADEHRRNELFYVTRFLSLAALFSVGAIGQQGTAVGVNKFNNTRDLASINLETHAAMSLYSLSD
jgi:hypothetical protein